MDRIYSAERNSKSGMRELVPDAQPCACADRCITVRSSIVHSEGLGKGDFALDRSGHDLSNRMRLLLHDPFSCERCSSIQQMDTGYRHCTGSLY